MEIVVEQHDFSRGGELLKEHENAHIIAVADFGFSMLSHYWNPFMKEIDYPGNGRKVAESMAIAKAAEENANELGKLGTLYPQFPITMVSKQYSRENEDTEKVISNLTANIQEFIDLNQSTIHATHILVDLSEGSGRPVPYSYILAMQAAFIRSEVGSVIEQVVILQEPPRQ